MYSSLTNKRLGTHHFLGNLTAKKFLFHDFLQQILKLSTFKIVIIVAKQTFLPYFAPFALDFLNYLLEGGGPGAIPVPA